MALRRAGGAVVVVAAVALTLAACTPDPEPPPTLTPTETFEAPTPEPAPAPEPESEPGLASHAVSAGHPAAVDAGMAMLAQGGSAVDAAIAAAFAVSVVEPFASGIGGGGSAIVVPPGGEPIAYDYREVVPASGAVPASNSGVPGFVMGMAELHAEHGVLPWEDLLAPAVALAEDGHPASQMMATQLRSGAGEAAAGGLAHFYPSGRPLSAGDPVLQNELADTLRALAEDPDAARTGSVGQAVAREVAGLDRPSLEGYSVQVSRPPSGDVAGWEVVSAAPALPGAALIQMLQVAEALGVAAAEPGSADYVHQLAAAWSLAVETVETRLGDPDFVDVPLDDITDADRNAERAASLASFGAQSASSGAGSLPPGAVASGAASSSVASLTSADVPERLRSTDRPGETTHLTVVDTDGLVVSMTNTLTYFWGSGQYVDGFFMNNQMVRFTVGAGGSNQPEPGRRSVSYGLPTVVLDREGRPVLALGSPGGVRIPMILGNVLVRWGLHGEPLEDAVAAPRFYAEGRDMDMELIPPGDVVGELRSRGYAVEGPIPADLFYFGSVQALEIDWSTGQVSGPVDTRREADMAVASPGTG